VVSSWQCAPVPSCPFLPVFGSAAQAITFLFVGPAVNILAIAYTGAAIGMDIAIARITLSIAFGIAIGLIMGWVYREDEAERFAQLADSGLFEGKTVVKPVVWIVFILLLSVLIVGTLQTHLLTNTWLSLHLPIELPPGLVSTLADLQLTPQGAILIIMLVILAPIAYLGLEGILERYNRWTFAAIILVGMTVLTAAPSVEEGSLIIGITGRFIGEVILLAAIGGFSWYGFTRDELARWLWETWKFVKQIFPLLILGVFLAGVFKAIIPESWIQNLTGQNTIWANLIGVLFGVFMYFPTLVEVPIARMFLDLGMNRGPLLAYLLADPALSIQSIMVTGNILGRRKTFTYVSLVVVFSTLAGYLFGLTLAAI
jgi:uncharacterized membrane protein YraQ (UPF0718 family)